MGRLLRNDKQMIEEAYPSGERAIELGDSPIRDLSERGMDVMPPSPSSAKEMKVNGSSESSSRQDLNSKPKVMEVSEEKLNVFVNFDNHQESKTKKKRTHKTRRIRKELQRSRFELEESQKEHCNTVVIKKQYLATTDVGVQTKQKEIEKDQDELDNVKLEEESYAKQMSKSDMSSKQRPHQYSIKTYEEKLNIVEIAYQKGNHYAAKRFNVSINNIHRWKVSCKRRPGAGRKINDPMMEKNLIEWMRDFKDKFQAVPQRKDVRAKAVALSKYKGFQASKGWYERFMDRNPDFRFLPKIRVSQNKKNKLLKCQNESEQSISDSVSSSQMIQENPEEAVFLPEEKNDEIVKLKEEAKVKMEVESPPRKNCITIGRCRQFNSPTISNIPMIPNQAQTPE